MIHTERFAPSPTGRLHLGHAFSAILAHDQAMAMGGRFLLRMEDLDRGRVRRAYIDGIREDLDWLGLHWAEPVLLQSTRISAYDAAIDALSDRDLVYACRCTRREIQEAIAAPQEGGPDGPTYPGTCRDAGLAIGPETALRLNMDRALDVIGVALPGLHFDETSSGTKRSHSILDADLSCTAGDVVLRRRDGAAAYHLAVVVDDAHQGITHVTRGEDLLPATPIHRVLQALLDLPTPIYHHHRLIRDADGKRLAKRHDALSLETLRTSGVTPAQIRERLGLT